MEHRISSTELVRRLGDVLGRIRYRGDTFTVERNGEPVARLVPVADATPTTVREAVLAWSRAAPAGAGFADALEEVNRADRSPEDPWGS
jgi:prevent-host-death family protein